MTCSRCAGLGPGSLAPFQGPPGPPGPAGPNYGFGSITYGHLVADPNSTDPAVAGNPITANVPLPLAFAADPAPLSYAHLNPPFVGLTLWDGTKVMGRAFADRFEVQVNLIVRSQRAGGSITLEVSNGPGAIPITADNKNLIKPAGVSERVTLLVRFETLAGVMANGAQLVLTSTVNAAIFRESVIVAPISILQPSPS
ncbi:MULTISPECIES: hypothetical protein [unclassified Methylobacterium]|uniref:hypothetical protein n=1 Tax=unclassified Methylobacterium TaxID=2615210 RepID=UPI00226A95CE|nr:MULTISPECIES: hypothetical protein [unclassified Methylobacterium]